MSTNCLFCACLVPPNGGMKNVDFNFIQPPGGDPPIIQQYLKAFLVLKKVLKIPDDVITQVLCLHSDNDGGLSHPEKWLFDVCDLCSESVLQFYEILKQISKLERKITRIGVELKGKIKKSSASTLLDGSSENTIIWKRVREEVLKSLSSEKPYAVNVNNRDAFQNNDYQIPAGILEQEEDADDIGDGIDHDEEVKVSLEELQCKIEVNALNQSIALDQSSFPPKSTSSSTTSTSILSPTYTKFTRERNGKKHPCWQCSHCPATFWSVPQVKTHVKLHEPNSPGVTCPESNCGWVLHPQRVSQHCSIHHKAKSQFSTKKCSLNTSTASSNFSPFKQDGRTYYACLLCPYRNNTPSKKRMLEHLQLHEEGSGGIPCGDCGCYVLSKKMGLHRKHPFFSSLKSYRKSQKTNDKNGEGEGNEEVEVPLDQLKPLVKIEVGTLIVPEPVSDSQQLSDDAKDDADPEEDQRSKRKKKECPECPYTTKKMKCYRSHLKVHEQGSDAVECEECGWYVFPSGLPNHNRIHHTTLVYSGFTTFRKGDKLAYRCSNCSAFFIQLPTMKAHVKLHEEGSGAIVCPHPNCGWSVLPSQLKKHSGFHHPNKESPIAVVKSSNYYKYVDEDGRKRLACRLCPFRTCDNVKKSIFEHLKLHGEEGGGIPCADCGWFVLPERLSLHRNLRHPDNPFQCRECGVHCTTLMEFQEHQKQHHHGGMIGGEEEGPMEEEDEEELQEESLDLKMEHQPCYKG